MLIYKFINEYLYQIQFRILASNFPLIVVGLILAMKFIVSMLVLYLNFLRNIFMTKLICIGSQIYGKKDKYLNAIGKDSSLIKKDKKISNSGLQNFRTFLLSTLRLQFCCGFSQRLQTYPTAERSFKRTSSNQRYFLSDLLCPTDFEIALRTPPRSPGT